MHTQRTHSGIDDSIDDSIDLPPTYATVMPPSCHRLCPGGSRPSLRNCCGRNCCRPSCRRSPRASSATRRPPPPFITPALARPRPRRSQVRSVLPTSFLTTAALGGLTHPSPTASIFLPALLPPSIFYLARRVAKAARRAEPGLPAARGRDLPHVVGLQPGPAEGRPRRRLKRRRAAAAAAAPLRRRRPRRRATAAAAARRAARRRALLLPRAAARVRGGAHVARVRGPCAPVLRARSAAACGTPPSAVNSLCSLPLCRRLQAPCRRPQPHALRHDLVLGCSPL